MLINTFDITLLKLININIKLNNIIIIKAKDYKREYKVNKILIAEIIISIL